VIEGPLTEVMIVRSDGKLENGAAGQLSPYYAKIEPAGEAGYDVNATLLIAAFRKNPPNCRGY